MGPKKKSNSKVTDPRETHPRTEVANGLRFPNILERVLSKTSAKHPPELLSAMSPTQVKEYIWGDKLQGALRSFLEPLGADTQCNNAEVKFISGKTPCWICGCTIETKEKKACEHILPIVRAVMLSGIETSKTYKNRAEFQQNDNITRLQQVTKNNYLWAHDNCNGSSGKSGLVLLTFDKGQNKFVADEDKCIKLTQRITGSKRDGFLERDDCYTRTGSSVINNMMKEIENQCIDINNEFEEFSRLVSEQIQDTTVDIVSLYIEYTIEIIKLYANSYALELLLTPEEQEELRKKNEEEERIREAEIKQLMEEQEKLREESEKKYVAYIQGVIKTKIVEYNPTRFTNYIPFVIRERCSLFLYNKDNSDILNIITEISIQITGEVTKLLEDFNDQYKSSHIGLIMSIIDFFSFCKMYQLSQEYGINMKKPGETDLRSKDSLNDTVINEYKCLYFYAIIDKVRKRMLLNNNEGDGELDFLKAQFGKYDIEFEDCNDFIANKDDELRKILSSKSIDDENGLTNTEIDKLAQKMFEVSDPTDVGYDIENARNLLHNRVANISENYEKKKSMVSSYVKDKEKKEKFVKIMQKYNTNQNFANEFDKSKIDKYNNALNDIFLYNLGGTRRKREKTNKKRRYTRRRKCKKSP